VLLVVLPPLAARLSAALQNFHLRGMKTCGTGDA
jgi:hypothetical protein